MPTIILSSRNQGKLDEFQALFDTSQFSIEPISNFTDEDVEETGLSFIENAILKARYAAKVTGMPALADDSGVMIDALNAEPGIYSARFAGKHGDMQACRDLVLSAMRDVPDERRGAQFVCVLAMVQHADDPLPLIAEGIWRGRITREERGKNGFGYDPIFWVDEHQCTAAELEPNVKNQISHRGLALEELKKTLI